MCDCFFGSDGLDMVNVPGEAAEFELTCPRNVVGMLVMSSQGFEGTENT